MGVVSHCQLLCCLTAAVSADPKALNRKTGQFEHIPLYRLKSQVAGKPPTYFCVRGTNKVENFFRSMHHDVLPGGNNGLVYAQQRLMMHALR